MVWTYKNDGETKSTHAQITRKCFSETFKPVLRSFLQIPKFLQNISPWLRGFFKTVLQKFIVCSKLFSKNHILSKRRKAEGKDRPGQDALRQTTYRSGGPARPPRAGRGARRRTRERRTCPATCQVAMLAETACHPHAVLLPWAADVTALPTSSARPSDSPLLAWPIVASLASQTCTGRRMCVKLGGEGRWGWGWGKKERHCIYAH